MITPRQLDLAHMLYMSGNNCHRCTKVTTAIFHHCSLHGDEAPVMNCMVNLHSTYFDIMCHACS